MTMAWRWSRLALGRRAVASAFGLSVGSAGAVFAPTHRDESRPEKIARRRRAVQYAPCVCEEPPRVKYGTCKLRDGRVLAYHEEGSGVPVFAFHGMGSSRYTWLGEQPLSQLCPGVRLIAVDRPGYGDSSPPPYGYSYTAFAKDIKELADALQCPRFCVVGHSSGGPYALAAAALLPDDVAACAAVSSDAPYAHPMAPAELREADDFRMPAKTCAIGLYGREVADLAESMRQGALNSGNQTKAYAWKSGTDGWVCDYTLERIPWSFAVEDIALGPRLTVWVGGEDIPAIAVGAPFLQQLVSGSELRIVPGGNHGFKSQPEHLAAILRELKAQFI